MRYFLGTEVIQSDKGIFICQSKYAKDVLKRFTMINCSPASTPVATGTKLSREEKGFNFDTTILRKLVGSLMYLTATRSDIMYGVSLKTRFMDSPKNSHWHTGKRILTYIAGTMDYRILYSTTDDFKMNGYTNSVFAGNIDDQKSTSGYEFHFGIGIVAWASKKQSIVTISSAEAEYVAKTSATCQAVWMRKVLKDLMHNQKEPTTIYCDNKSNSSIALSKNRVFRKRSKHIDTRYHFI
ncbi:secreted RxLR effector protein 161-like [Cryptomeria japonica]|uniref:secreted RxLR effector protein 161-like n=1 Tax=Cryptomeria japonica TaxID=3369 RepID=UPI0027DA5828|nr:secreted RxLR effector protein 161-like [Cryptomeria japonica]